MNIHFYYHQRKLNLITPTTNTNSIILFSTCDLVLSIITSLTGGSISYTHLAKTSIKELRNKEVWDKISNSCSIQFQRNWPYGFLAQIIVFFIFLYGIGNLIIMLLSWFFISALEMMGIQVANLNATYNASLYFLKNMTVIPLTFVYILNMIGFRSTNQ